MMRLPFRRAVIESLSALRQALIASLGYLFFLPLSCLVSRDPKLIVVISRPGRLFGDNSKYFFIYATALADVSERVIFFTANPAILRQIIDAGGEALLHPSWTSFITLLRCGKVATDSILFENKPLTRGARLIQLWHGAPLKHIELDTYRRRIEETSAWLVPFLKIQKLIIERYPVYDLVLSTSKKFIDEAFRYSFRARRFIAAGYPRNDILFGWPDSRRSQRLAMINVDREAMDRVVSAQAAGQRICLYVPTFRNGLDNPFDGQIDLNDLSSFSQQQQLCIVLKLHPFMHGKYRIANYPNLIDYEPLADIYPLMARCDFMLTDYSSIFFDFLLLDRPILFFAYDLRDYLLNDRSMYFDYHTMTPGVKCHDYHSLKKAIAEILSNGCRDNYAEMRRMVSEYTHDYKDNRASQRLMREVRKLS